MYYVSGISYYLKVCYVKQINFLFILLFLWSYDPLHLFSMQRTKKSTFLMENSGVSK